MENEKGWVPFNGKTSTLARIIEALVVAAIVGGISVYGNSRVIDVRLDQICASITKLDRVAEHLDKTMQILEKRDSVQDIRLQSLEKMHSWDGNRHKK